MTKVNVATINVITIFFYIVEGPRAYVHVKHKDGTETSIWLDDFSIKKSSRDTVFDRLAIKAAKKYSESAQERWDEIHGDNDE